MPTEIIFKTHLWVTALVPDALVGQALDSPDDRLNCPYPWALPDGPARRYEPSLPRLSVPEQETIGFDTVVNVYIYTITQFYIYIFCGFLTVAHGFVTEIHV